MSRIGSFFRDNVLSFIPQKVRFVFVILVGILTLFICLEVASSHIKTFNEGVIGKKIDYAKHYIYWRYRVWRFEESMSLVEPEKRSTGSIDGVTKSGKLLIRLYSNEGIYQITSHLADLKITNLNQAALVINNYRKKTVTVDYYRTGGDAVDDYAVVVWLPEGMPLNEVLINQKVAVALETPPTNIVNRMMAQYYKGLLF